MRSTVIFFYLFQFLLNDTSTFRSFCVISQRTVDIGQKSKQTTRRRERGGCSEKAKTNLPTTQPAASTSDPYHYPATNKLLLNNFWSQNSWRSRWYIIPEFKGKGKCVSAMSHSDNQRKPLSLICIYSVFSNDWQAYLSQIRNLWTQTGLSSSF